MLYNFLLIKLKIKLQNILKKCSMNKEILYTIKEKKQIIICISLKKELVNITIMMIFFEYIKLLVELFYITEKRCRDEENYLVFSKLKGG